MFASILHIFPARVWIAGAVVVAIVVTVMLLAYQRDRAATEAAKARSAAIVAEGQAKAASEAAEAVAANAERRADSEDLTRTNRDAILSTDGANAPVPGAVGDAGRRALCLRHASRNDPACVELLKPRPE